MWSGEKNTHCLEQSSLSATGSLLSGGAFRQHGISCLLANKTLQLDQLRLSVWKFNTGPQQSDFSKKMSYFRGPFCMSSHSCIHLWLSFFLSNMTNEGISRSIQNHWRWLIRMSKINEFCRLTLDPPHMHGSLELHLRPVPLSWANHQKWALALPGEPRWRMAEGPSPLRKSAENLKILNPSSPWFQFAQVCPKSFWPKSP